MRLSSKPGTPSSHKRRITPQRSEGVEMAAVPTRHHLDKRALEILAGGSDAVRRAFERLSAAGLSDEEIQALVAALADDSQGDADDLLTTDQTAEWLGVSTQWLEIGRSTGRYGPPFERLSPKRIRYRRGGVRNWLAERAHQSTAEYKSWR